MFKFEASNAMIPGELRPWEVLQTQTPIKSVKKIDYHPINSLSSSDTVNFDLPSLSNFMLKNIQIVTQVLVEKEGVKSFPFALAACRTYSQQSDFNNESNGAKL